MNLTDKNIEHSHWVYFPRSTLKSRDILVIFVNSNITDKILRKTNELEEIKWDCEKILFFQGISVAPLLRRKALKPLSEKLMQNEIRYKFPFLSIIVSMPLRTKNCFQFD